MEGIMPRPEHMKAMVLQHQGHPLVEMVLEAPRPAAGQVLVKVQACGVCRTDLHVVDGELRNPKLPLVPGHMIVGTVAAKGASAALDIGLRVGIPWLGGTCGSCGHCLKQRENLCDHALFTGYTLDGGYAEYTLADAQYCFAVPDQPAASEIAPLLCAGLIGYRSYRMIGDDVERLGLYGFGNAAHIVAQVAAAQGREFYAFTSPGDFAAQDFARVLGAKWAGSSLERPPVELDAAIIFAPAGPLVPAALRAVRKGGTVVCGGIHMSDIPSFPYELLWGERVLRSVANLTRNDGLELLGLATALKIRTEVEMFPLDQANQALERLRGGKIQGGAVLGIAC
jgi:alcohol dehydrogenase, propanol-preferring